MRFYWKDNLSQFLQLCFGLSPLRFLKAIKNSNCLSLLNRYTNYSLPRRCAFYRQENRGNSSRSRYIDSPPAIIRFRNKSGKANDGSYTKDKVPKHDNKLKGNVYLFSTGKSPENQVAVPRSLSELSSIYFKVDKDLG